LLENAPLHVAAKPATPAAQVERTRRLRRSFLRQYLKRRPTRLEALALDRAASLTALSEALAADPTSHPDTLVRLENLAVRARGALAKLKPPREPALPSLQELLSEAAQ
jgi:hypothetical protein